MMFSGNLRLHPRLANWEFVACSGDDLRDQPWHASERLDRGLGDPTTAERLVRIHARESAGPAVFVRGWILHPDLAPLHLDGWHRALWCPPVMDDAAVPTRHGRRR